MDKGYVQRDGYSVVKEGAYVVCTPYTYVVRKKKKKGKKEELPCGRDRETAVAAMYPRSVIATYLTFKGPSRPILAVEEKEGHPNIPRHSTFFLPPCPPTDQPPVQGPAATRSEPNKQKERYGEEARR